MENSVINTFYSQDPRTEDLRNSILHTEKNIELTGLVGSSLSMVVAEVFKNTDLPFLLVLDNKEEAAYHLNDLENLLGDKHVLFYPSSYRRPYQIEETDNANVLLRSEVLNRINSRKKPALIVAYPEALFEK